MSASLIDNPMTDDTHKGPKIPPPPPPRAQRRGIMVEPPKPNAAPDNMQKPNSGTQDLNFKVDPEFHFAFKMIATKRKMPMKDLLDATLRCWLETYGDPQEQSWLPPKMEK